MLLAKEESNKLGYPAVGTEHLLLGLIREDMVLQARAIGSLGIKNEVVRKEIAKLVGKGKVKGGRRVRK